MDAKEIRTLERVFKGVANHWRIKTMLLISSIPGISLEDIVAELKGNYQTISEHARRLKIAGLIMKKYRGKIVEHTLSPFGERMIKIIKSFLHS